MQDKYIDIINPMQTKIQSNQVKARQKQYDQTKPM